MWPTQLNGGQRPLMVLKKKKKNNPARYSKLAGQPVLEEWRRGRAEAMKRLLKKDFHFQILLLKKKDLAHVSPNEIFCHVYFTMQRFIRSDRYFIYIYFN